MVPTKRIYSARINANVRTQQYVVKSRSSHDYTTWKRLLWSCRNSHLTSGSFGLRCTVLILHKAGKIICNLM